ncbi:tetratricopeptide repeat protein [bacterium]|nr:tetratricopeptide repeat protein [bacterium]MCI0606736.1 tetratricopeptide repeat protein [bacterium]
MLKIRCIALIFVLNCFVFQLAQAKESPGQIVLAAANAVQQKDFKTFQKYVDPRFFQSLFEMQTGESENASPLTEKQKVEARKNFYRQVEADFLTGRGQMYFNCQNPVIQEERIVAEDAQVTIQCSRDSESVIQKLVVRKSEGKWKVVLPDYWRDAIDRITRLRKNKKYEEALQQSVELASKFPNSGNIRNLTSDIYLNDLQEPERALESALRTKQELPRHPGGYYWAAKAYDRLEKYEECVTVLDQLVQFENWYGYFRDLANCYYKNGQYTEALAALGRVATSSPQAWEQMAGWQVWLQGQMEKKKIFGLHQNELNNQVRSKDSQQLAVALIKLGSLEVPETMPLLDQLARDLTLSPALNKLKAAIILHADFKKKWEAPSSGSEGQRIPAQDALQAIWQRFESIPQGVRPPPLLSGKYMMESMVEYAKANPSYATPLSIEFNEEGDALSFGIGTVPVDGKLIPSDSDPYFISALFVSEKMLHNATADLRPGLKSYTFTLYKMAGKDLVISSDHWADRGEFFYRTTAETKYVRIE